MEGVLLFKALTAFVFVISLMFLVSWIMRKTGIGNNIPIIGANTRIKLEEVLVVDSTRKLAIISKDNKEYFIFMGTKNEMVIETRDAPEKPKKKSTKDKKDNEYDIYKDLA